MEEILDLGQGENLVCIPQDTDTYETETLLF
jgi:hypothetical protein